MAYELRYLLILQAESVGGLIDSLVGLPIDSAPSIQSIKLSAFQPLPEIYRKHSNIHCVSAMSVTVTADSVAQGLDRPSIFLLDATSIISG